MINIYQENRIGVEEMQLLDHILYSGHYIKIFICSSKQKHLKLPSGWK